MVAARTSSLYAAQGVGALIAAFMAAYFSSADKQKMLILGQIAFIFPIIALGFVSNTEFALILLVFIGWGTVVQLVMINTMIQIDVPDGLRGRVFSVYFWALQGVAPFGSIVIGWMAQTWNVPVTIVVGGLVCLFGVLGIRISLGSARKSSG
jgi:predicted MFS family arabinose efflux permease